MNARSRAVLGLSIAYTLSSPAVWCEPTSADKSLATQLFKEGRALVDQGKVAEGCRKLEESQRLDPGGGTLLNVALCHEKEGRSASAWAEFTEALGIARKDDRPQRAEIAQAHIDALEPTLSRLVVQVPTTADLPDLEIKRDNSTIRRAAWGTAMPVDPGDHVIEASARGKIPWKHTVTVGGKAEVKTIAIPPLEDAPVVATPPPVSSAPTTTIVEVKPPSHAAAWVALGFGAAGLAVGSIFGIQAMSEKKTADGDCRPEGCGSEGARANDAAIRAANFSTVGFGVGIVGLGLGTYLLLTNSASRTTTAARVAGSSVMVDATPSQLTFRGTW